MNGWVLSWAIYRMLDWFFFVGIGYLIIFGVLFIMYVFFKYFSIFEFKLYVIVFMGFFIKCMCYGMVLILFFGLWMMVVSTGVFMLDVKFIVMFGFFFLYKFDV